MKALSSGRIILHCSATREGVDIDTATIRQWHLKRGFRDVGYHFVIRIDGRVELGRPLSSQGSHTRGENDSIGICYIGGLNVDGVPTDTMTEMQEISWLRLVDSLRLIFGHLTIDGHNSFSSKACPSFDVKEKYSWLAEDSPESY
jgi:N-acetylmuramoyl-L-alanine amidase